jgi:uncharacterized protein (DUF433 family)
MISHDDLDIRICYGRSMSNRLNRITSDPQICGGRPCIRGQRIRVVDILDMLAAGAARAEILRDYPYLEDEDIAAALEYAAKHLDHPVIRPI